MSEPELLAWLDERLEAAGRHRTGPLTVFRERAWATVHTAPTDAGPVWLKTAAPDTAAEVGLYEMRTVTAPDCVLVPLAVDVGVADMRPAALPQRFDAALEAVTPYATATAAGGAAELRRLHDPRPTYVERCAELDATGIPASLDHNDLHPANVVGSADRPRFYDWGDSVVAHPFTSLMTVYDAFPAAAHARLSDAYPGKFGEPAALRPTAALACRAGNVVLALVWARAIGADADPRFAAAPFAYLRRMLEP